MNPTPTVRPRPALSPRRGVSAFAFLAWLLAAAFFSNTAIAAESPKLKVLIITGGHGFEKKPFFEVFDQIPEITHSTIAHKTNASGFERDDLLSHDVVVLYDMPKTITESQKAKFLAMFDKGIGLVVLHHALVSYQHWPEYERIIGGRYPEADGKSGVVSPKVGYQHDVDVPVVIAAPDHPITAGLKDFTIRDEIYWGFRVQPDVTPLLTTTHPKSGKPLAWTRIEGKSRVVYLQLGHDHTAYENPNYRRLVAQSIQWAAAKSASSAGGSAPQRPGVSAELRKQVAAQVADAYLRLEPLYKQFHANPELSLREDKTSERVANELEQLGFAVTRRVGGYGVVGLLKNGAGPTVLVRTDMDALPVTEQTGASYASSAKATDDKANSVGVMHACGHDMHMTVFLGTARVLSQLKPNWNGTLVMIGQPAEEKVQGARAMLADGLFTRFPKPDYCLALHCAPEMPAGMVGVTEGYALANVDSVDIVIRGVSGHGAWPHKTKDPIVLAAQTVLALQTIVSRETDPTQPAVVTVGSIHGGAKHNIIPDEVRLQLTLRSYSDEVREHTITSIKRITRGLADAAGIPPERAPVVTIADESAAATYNTPELASRLMGVFKTWLGAERTVSTKPIMGAEDFGLFGRAEPKTPICIFWLGTVNAQNFKEYQAAGKPLPALHSSEFLPAIEPTFKTGVTAMSAAVLDLLAASSR